MQCPTNTITATGEPHTIVGCGSTNVSEPDFEGIVDCLDCGIWFRPEDEEDALTYTGVTPARGAGTT